MSRSRKQVSPYLVLLLVVCASAGAGGSAPGYDMNSWKTIIADDCRAFYDGCNQCVREPGNAVAACTRMACADYRRPKCRDDGPAVMSRPEAAKTVNYACADGARFAVIYPEYRQDEQRVRPGESEIMLRDEQTHSLYRLQRERSASGEKYADASSGLQFFAKGEEALLMQQGKRLYADCGVHH